MPRQRCKLASVVNLRLRICSRTHFRRRPVIYPLAEPQMPIVSMRQLLDHAAENGYGIPAFNVNNLEQVQACLLYTSRCV